MKRMLTKGLLTILLLWTTAAGIWGQETPVYGHYFGFASGTSTGVGLSYRSWPGTFGVQVTGMPVFQNDSQFGSLGLTGLWTLQDLRWTKFFTYVSAGSLLSRSAYTETKLDGTEVHYIHWSGQAALGAGIGFEFLWFDHIAFDLMAGYGLQTSLPEATTYGTTFSVESGLFYRTKL